MASWNYIYQRRGWTIRSVIAGLQERTWENFVEFHDRNRMSCPSRAEYDAVIVELSSQKVRNVKASTPKPVRKKRTRTTKAKGATNEGKKQRTRKKTS